VLLVALDSKEIRMYKDKVLIYTLAIEVSNRREAMEVVRILQRE
jgi:hypothetical protein